MSSATIKTHHNLALPQRMLEGQGLRLIEPLRELFKDEVRDLGMQLGIPHEIVMRHPFPGMLKYFTEITCTANTKYDCGLPH